MMRSMIPAWALALALSIVAVGEEAPPAPDTQPKEPKPEEKEGPKDDPEALKALKAGAELAMKKKFTLKGTMDVEVGGSPMFAMELTGEHAGKWTHYKTEMMGSPIELYTDGETTLTLDPQSGEWKKQGAGGGGGRRGRGGMRGGLGIDQVVQAVKSARFDGEAKVGSHVCRVIRGKADVEAIKKMLGGRNAGGADVKKSSLKFYVDKEDGRVRKFKLSMDASSNMGGQQMDLTISSSYRYTFSKDVKVELPEEAKKALEAEDETPEDPHAVPPKEGEKPKEGETPKEDPK